MRLLLPAALCCVLLVRSALGGVHRAINRHAHAQYAAELLQTESYEIPSPSALRGSLLASTSSDAASQTTSYSASLVHDHDGTAGRYCESGVHAKAGQPGMTRRFPSRTVHVGRVLLGSEHPVALQTMTTSDTKNVTATVEQVIRIAEAGADIVRITVQGPAEAKACMKIRQELNDRGYDIPLVADIHFNPKVAMMVADAFEKIRINPGNFADGAKKLDEPALESEDDFIKGRDKIEELFTPLVLKLKRLGRALRIGTNHGSLSARILANFGDSPRGMVASAMEFALICRKHDYHNFVFSMKASNPVVMVQAYRLLVAEQYARGWDYPVHLGVTEAGEGEDGRLKSAIGIGALLADGIGDTIRVSLTEDPWLELPVARTLRRVAEERLALAQQGGSGGVPPYTETTRDFTSFARREVALPSQRGGDRADVRPWLHRDGSVLLSVTDADLAQPEALYKSLGCKLAVGMPIKDIATVDTIYAHTLPHHTHSRTLRRLQDAGLGLMVPWDELVRIDSETHKHYQNLDFIALVSLDQLKRARDNKQDVSNVLARANVMRYAVSVRGDELESDLARILETGETQVAEVIERSVFDFAPMLVVLSPPETISRLHASRRIFDFLKRHNSRVPAIHRLAYPPDMGGEETSIRLGMDAGSLLVDGLGEGVWVEQQGAEVDGLRSLAFNLLQGSRMRTTKTEFISCPSCGRTLFDLQEVTDQIRRRTGHLPGVAIAVMGCIVNGPGEMADADFGYVGGAPGKVDLYVGKKCVERGIPNETACDRLIELIKAHGKWVEPPKAE